MYKRESSILISEAAIIIHSDDKYGSGTHREAYQKIGEDFIRTSGVSPLGNCELKPYIYT